MGSALEVAVLAGDGDEVRDVEVGELEVFHRPMLQTGRVW